MSDSDVCDNADIRACDSRQAGHLPETADSHLEHSDLMLFPDLKYSERKSDFIVEVPLCFEHGKSLRQDGGNHLFCARLADASGDSYDFDIKRTAVMFRNVF